MNWQPPDYSIAEAIDVLSVLVHGVKEIRHEGEKTKGAEDTAQLGSDKAGNQDNTEQAGTPVT